MKFSALLFCVTLCCVNLAWAGSYRAGFTIAFEDIETDLPIMSTGVMPSATLVIKTTAHAISETGTLHRSADEWHWMAPDKPGRAEIVFHQEQDTIRLNVFILTPFKNGLQDNLNGFRVGRYVSELFRGLSSYSAPQGFIELASGPADLAVSPHFTLGQFICKQQPGHDPSYLLLRPGMLIKLETLLEAANERGWRADTFHVMSGFRTPWYNRSIGNTTTTSRHLYGGAADIWIDHDGDGVIDDLNRDGRINRQDAKVLADLAEELAERGGRDWPPGGIGIYNANAVHGPFIHIDARGYRARW